VAGLDRRLEGRAAVLDAAGAVQAPVRERPRDELPELSLP